MKNFLFALAILLCIGLLIFGKIQYDYKLNGIAQEAKETMSLSVELNNQSGDRNEHFGIDDIGNITPELKEKLMTAITNNESLRVAFFGSNAIAALEENELSWTDLVIEELLYTYGEGLFDVKIFEVGNQTSSDVIQAGLHNEIAEFQPDVLIFEPFILNDNGNAPMNVTLDNLTTIIADIEELAPEVFVVLQPPNPIFKPNIYLRQVEGLMDYSEENGYTYINHWEAWPDITDDTINDYLVNHQPNQQGHEIWAGVLIEFFTGKIVD